MMWAYERVMWGPLTKAVNVALTDLSRREIAVMVPLLALMFFMGLYPRPLLNRIQPSVDALLARVRNPPAQIQHQRISADSGLRAPSSAASLVYTSRARSQ